MLILAGVSLNAIVGDNGIITNAQQASLKSGMAALEEFLQEKYVENYDKVNEYTDKIDGLLYGTDAKKYFQKAANNDLFFLDKTTYREYYFIEKKNLPQEIRDGLIGGNNSLTGKTMYAEFNDIYGINNNLEVFYCSDGYESWTGGNDIAKETNLSRSIASSSSGWGEVLGIGNKDVTLSDFKASNGSLVINKSNLDLTILANFPNLTKLEFVNCSYDNLQGLEYAPDVTVLYIEGTASIRDYSEIGQLKKLQQLYFIGTSDNEVEKCFSKDSTGIGNFDFQNLTRVALTNDDYRHYWDTEATGSVYESGYSTCLPLKNLSEITRRKITHINISTNKITSLEGLNQFPNLLYLKAGGNKITTLTGLEGLKKIQYLDLHNNSLGKDIEDNSIDDKEDVLHVIASIKTTDSKVENYTFNNNFPELYWLHLGGNPDLIWVNYVKNCDKLRYLYLAGCPKINSNSIVALKEKFNNFYWGYTYDSAFNLALKPLTTTSLDLTGEEYTQTVFESLKNYTQLSSLNLTNVKLYTLKDDGTKEYITGENLNKIANDVLGNFSGMYALSLNGWSTLNDISFVNNMTYINNLDLRNTSVITGTTKEVTESGVKKSVNTGLELLNDRGNMYSLAINGASIDLAKIQPLIDVLGIDKSDSKVYPAGYTGLRQISGQSSGYGLRCENNASLATLSKCTEIHSFIAYTKDWGGQTNNVTINLSNCTNLTFFSENWCRGATYTMPSSLEELYSGPGSSNNYNLTNCTSLEKIGLSENGNTGNILNSIRAYTTLTVIDASGWGAPQHMIDSVDNWKKCINLESLSFYQSHWWSTLLTVDSLKFMEKLSTLTNLKTLYMRYIDVTDKNWSYLSNLSYLENLTIRECTITDISCFNTMNNLVSVNLSNSKIVNGLYALNGKKTITTISLGGTPVGDLSEYDKKNYNTIDILLSLRPANGGMLSTWNFGNNQTADEKSRMK